MDEQRILDEMERMLAADDPRLAARLAAFGQPGFGQALRTRRARATLSVMVLILIAAVAAVVYLMSVLRPGTVPTIHGQGQGQTSPARPRDPATQPGSERISASPTGRTSRQTTQRTNIGSVTQCAASLPPPRCGTWGSAPG